MLEVHRIQMPMRWSDLDAFGHLNNVQYLRFMEQARVEWLESFRGFPPGGSLDGLAAMGPLPVVARLDCNFRAPVHYPATLSVILFLTGAGRTSLATWTEIRSDDGAVLHAEGAATLVWVDLINGRPVELPPAVREQVRALPAPSAGALPGVE